MRHVDVALGERGYSVHVGRGALGTIPASDRRVIIVDENVARLHGHRLHAATRVVIRAGEEQKSLSTVSQIYDDLLAIPVNRETTLVGLGGGVTLDIAGFVASTLLRGLKLELAPTTLLAQVDAAIGGKNGVNHARGKNLIGTFYQPAAVFADIDTLSTLEEREYRAGFAEIIKIAAIRDAALFDLVERESARLLARDGALLEDVVSRAVANKAAVVSADERESGLRRTLNFGHTVGHAIEQSTGYSKLLHGEAVAIGMNAALAVGELRERTPATVRRRVVALCEAFGLPTDFKPFLATNRGLAEPLALDKKSQGKHDILFVIVPSIGTSLVEPLTTEGILGYLRRDRP